MRGDVCRKASWQTQRRKRAWLVPGEQQEASMYVCVGGDPGAGRWRPLPLCPHCLLTQLFPALPPRLHRTPGCRDHFCRPRMNTQELRETAGQSLSSWLQGRLRKLNM